MFDLITLVQAAGTLGVIAVVFLESGLLIGIILPGDSLLFTAGLLASQGYANIAVLAVGSFLAAVLGDNTGYWLGHRFGRRIFSRPDSFFLNPKHIHRAERYYATHGTKTIFLARFIPIVRTLAPVLAGIGSMRWRTFFRYNVIGGLMWGAGVPLAGYWLGSAIPNVDHYLLPIIAGIIVLSLVPTVIEYLRRG